MAVINDLHLRFNGLTSSTDAFRIFTDIHNGNDNDLRLLATHYGLNFGALQIEWANLQDILILDAMDSVHEITAYTCDRKSDYPLLAYLFQIFIVLPTSTADVERGFSKMNFIKSKDRNRMGDVLIHCLLISLYGGAFEWDWKTMGHYVATKVWNYKKA